MRTILMIMCVVIVFYGLVMVKLQEEQQTRIQELKKESERLDKVRDSLLIVRDKSMKELDSLVNVMNNIK